MAMESSSVSAGTQPVTHPVNVAVNPLQLLWLQESGIDRLWGRPLTISGPAAAEQSAPAPSGNVPTAGTASAAQTVRAELVHSAAARHDSAAAASAGEPAAAPAARTHEQPQNSPARQALAKLREQMQRPRRTAGQAGAATQHAAPMEQAAPLAHADSIEQATAAQASNVSAGAAAAQRGAVLSESLARPAPPPSQYSDSEWPDLAATIRQCTRCSLSEHARQPIPGTGTVTARLMIIDQAPGAQDEINGEPLSGQAGQLLDNMLAAIGLSRDATFITDVVKCRPMVSRPPESHEIEACADFLQRQFALVQPACVLLFGNAAQSVLGTSKPVGQLRQDEDLTITINDRAVPVIVTFHPNHLLANQAAKPLAWEDLKRLRKILLQL